MQNRIRELRLSIPLTQTALAQKLGLNQSAVGKYERGELEPSIATLAKLSEIFDCTVDYILGLEDDAGMKPIRFTENEKSLGVGNHATRLSNEEWDWIETLSELKRVKGNDAVTAVLTMVKTLIETKK